jgi:phosphate starvation-inducible PhoH-like protein
VSVDNEQLGFLPGDLNSKMSVWSEHFIELFNTIHSKNEIEKLVRNDVIKIKPMAYLRGKTFDNSLIISDEMQNSSPTQLKMLLTRLGEDSKLILLGDPNQRDIDKTSGLDDFLKKYKYYFDGLGEDEKNNTSIKIVHMEDSDVLRSPVVKEVLNIYNVKMNKPIVVKNNTYVKKDNNSNSDCSLFTPLDEMVYGRWKPV